MCWCSPGMFGGPYYCEMPIPTLLGLKCSAAAKASVEAGQPRATRGGDLKLYVEKAISLSPPPWIPDVIDVTTHDSPGKQFEKLATVVKPKIVRFEFAGDDVYAIDDTGRRFYFDSDDAAHRQMMGLDAVPISMAQPITKPKTVTPPSEPVCKPGGLLMFDREIELP